jgi:hypothetical protein
MERKIRAPRGEASRRTRCAPVKAQAPQLHPVSSDVSSLLESSAPVRREGARVAKIVKVLLRRRFICAFQCFETMCSCARKGCPLDSVLAHTEGCQVMSKLVKEGILNSMEFLEQRIALLLYEAGP